MSAQQQVNPGSGGQVCSSEAIVTGPLGLGVAMASRNVSTPLFFSLPQPEFSGTVRARNGGQEPSPQKCGRGSGPLLSTHTGTCLEGAIPFSVFHWVE